MKDARAWELQRQAAELRAQLVALSHRARTPHLGSGLSCLDLLVVTFWDFLDWQADHLNSIQRDRFVFSKGHAAAALYLTLAARGLLDPQLLATYNQPGAVLAEQPLPFAVPGLELATGSLGHGLPVGVGMALGQRLQDLPHRVLVLMSDGECNEGSVWEAAMMASAQKLERLTIMIDFNGWQATGRSREILALEPLVDKWRAFGWAACEIDGHDPEAICSALKQPHAGQPLAIVARTLKGKGVSFMQDDNNWHYRIPTATEVEQATQELLGAYR